MSNFEFELLQPSAFLSSSKFDFNSLTKKLFAIARPADSQVLETLVTTDFDSNQVYEQIEMLNREVLERIDIEQVVGTCIAVESDLDLEISNLNDGSEDYEGSSDEQDLEETLAEEEQSDSDQEYSEMEQDVDQDDRFEDDFEKVVVSKKKKSVVDDQFFSLEEMEKFADMSERQDIKMANKLSNKNEESDEEEDEMDMFSIGKDLANNGFDFDFDDDEDNANGKICF